MPLLAKTISGLEEILVRELTELGASDLKILKRAVSFQGNQELLYRSNYCCRTALRILLPILTFEIKEQADLYNGVNSIEWEMYLDSDQTLAVDAVIGDSVFTNSQFVSMRTKDAIVDRFRSKTGSRPSVSLDDPDFRINVHIYRGSCTVSLDSSGRSLHKRGYRQEAGIAPLNEVLAAGLLQLSGWDRKVPLVDPMCGSGTILIEGAMLAYNIPPGVFNPNFGFMKWKDFNKELWMKIKEEEDAKITPSQGTFIGIDISGRAVDGALRNIEFSGFSEIIKIEKNSFANVLPPPGSGFVVTNPPYDERIQMEDIIDFYKKIGDTLKKKYTGYEAWVISSDLRALKFIGLHPSKKVTIFNGPLECRLVRFTLY